MLDEPVSGLDPKVTAEFYDLTKELNKTGITIIMVSHDIKAITEFSDHILHIGKDNVFFGTTEEYLKSSIAKEIGLNRGEEG